MAFRKSKRKIPDPKKAFELFDTGRIPQAAKALEKVLSKDPNHVQASFILGVCYFRMKNLDRAQKLFRRVVSLEQRHYNAHYYLGLILERQSRMDEAVVEFKWALKLKPDFKEAKKKLSIYNKNPPDSPDGIDQLAPASRMDQESIIAGELIYKGRRRKRSFSLLFLLMIIFILIAMFWWPYSIHVIEHEGAPEDIVIFAIIPTCVSILLLIYLSLKSRTTRYWIYENRIDFKVGLFFKRELSLWVYQIQDTWLTRSPFNLLTKDATIHFRSAGLETPTRRGTRTGHFKIKGLGNYKFMEKFWNEIRDAALVRRRAMKKWWV